MLVQSYIPKHVCILVHQQKLNANPIVQHACKHAAVFGLPCFYGFALVDHRRMRALVAVE